MLSHANAKQDKKAQGFKISLFYWSFSSGIMAMKGLRKPNVNTQLAVKVTPSGSRRQTDRKSKSDSHVAVCFKRTVKNDVD